MRRRLKPVELFLAVGLAVSLGACGGAVTPEQSSDPPAATLGSEGGEGGEGGEGSEGGAATENLNWANTFADGQVVSEFASQVVVPKYSQYVNTTAKLRQAIDAFVKAPTPANLTVAREVWTAARISWEQTETFAFGPAGSLGLDGAMDSWPINQTDIEQILADSEPITPARVATLQDTERGMHTIEYLLFGEANNKTADQFSDREKQYLQALGQDLNGLAQRLLDSWQKGVDGQPPYITLLSTAGSPENTVYPTVSAAAQEVVTGILDSLTEVGEDKLKAPFVDQDPVGLESRFSQQTINDLKSNLKSAENGYLGSFPEAGAQASVSISSYVAAANPALDQTIKAQFEAAETALAAVPTPIETSLTDPAASTEINAAIAAILEVKETIQTQVVPLI